MANYTSSRDFIEMTPGEFRGVVRKGEWTGDTVEACRGYAMANLTVVPKEYAFEFLLFCHRNPRSCPVIDVTDPGSPHPRLVAPDADLRTDLAKYRVLENGQVIDEPVDITDYWRDDLVAFLLGCSGSFDWALKASNVHYRLIGAYTTNICCRPAGRFHGHMVVTCRLFESVLDAVRAIQITSRHLYMHGPPVHIGDPTAIGIKDLCQPSIPDITMKISPQRPNEIALFWACGVTPERVAIEAKLPFMITHYPAHTFVTDKLCEELAVL